MLTINYFGTDLRTHGHYIWTLEGNRFTEKQYSKQDLPFDPEDSDLLYPIAKGAKRVKGEVIWQFLPCGYSVLYIECSPVDQRPGSKSVFWVEGHMIREEMIQRISGIQIALNIIVAMESQLPQWFRDIFDKCCDLPF